MPASVRPRPIPIISTALSYSNTGTATKDYEVLASDLEIEEKSKLTIQIILNTSTTVQLKLTPAGETTPQTGYINVGSALNADAWYEFEFTVHNGDLINFVIQVPAGATLSGFLRVLKE